MEVDVMDGVSPLGVQLPSFEVGVVTFCSFEGDWRGVWGFVGEVVGVVGRIVVDGEGEGDSGRRKGEVRGEPKDRGEGL